ncbi:uncharacterized protein [Rutidosis leptorrhynchoides]|uniref:uncharacterized protein n=1 Tax=Rutidosis leptorrhynchoides TaxID=125765 RepID=UPI003A9A64AB
MAKRSSIETNKNIDGDDGFVHGDGEEWVVVVMVAECGGVNKASLLLNGSPSAEFDIERGLRQSDPLSPLLFIIGMEGINAALKDATASSLYSGLLVNNQVKGMIRMRPTFSQFWDVSLLLLASKINIQKSCLYGVAINAQEMESEHAFISIGGRSTLVKSVLGSLGTFFMSLFKMPVSFLKNLEAIRASFLWGGSDNVRKIHWVMWDSILNPIEFSVLGVNSLKSLNLALLYKWR